MASPASKKRKQCDFSEQTIVVEVGLQKKCFTVHPSILRSNSNSFKAAISAGWRARTCPTTHLSLPGEQPRTFETYIGYVYSGQIDDDEHVARTPAKKSETERISDRHALLGNLYVLGEHLDDKGLRNAVIDALFDLSSRNGYSVFTTSIILAFEETRENSTLCRYIVDSGLAGTNPGWLDANYDLLPKAFLKQVTMGWAKASNDKTIKHKPPVEMPPCTYHEHDEEVPQDDACAAVAASAMVANKKRKR